MGPMPGIVAKRWLTGLSLQQMLGHWQISLEGHTGL
jgi:hypothetical protein